MPEVKREGRQAFQALSDALGGLDGVQSKVGWFENSFYPDGTPVAYVMAIQEQGSPANSIPSRSFFRSTAIEKDAEWRDVANKVSKRVLEGKMTPLEAMEAIALKAEGDVAHKISTIEEPPLSKITLGVRKYKQMGKKVTGATIGEIARKLDEGTLDVSGVSTKPLVDSALAVNSLTHVTEKV